MPRLIGDLSRSFSRSVIAFGVLLSLVVVSASVAHDAPNRTEQGTAPQSSSTQPYPKPADEVGPADSELRVWASPDLRYHSDKNAPPLTPRGIFTQNVTDPFTFEGTALQAGNRTDDE